MGLPFLAEYGLATGDPALVADARRQMQSALTRRPAGLFAHGHDDARAQDRADPLTGQNAALWSRSPGWLAMALVELAELVEICHVAGLGGNGHRRRDGGLPCLGTARGG